MPIDIATIIRTEKLLTILFSRAIHWVLPFTQTLDIYPRVC